MVKEQYFENVEWHVGDIAAVNLWAMQELLEKAGYLFDQNIVWMYMIQGIVPEIRGVSGAEVVYRSHGFNIRILAPSMTPIARIIEDQVIWSCKEPEIEFDHKELEFDLPRHRNLIYGVTQGIKRGLQEEFRLIPKGETSLVFPKRIYAKTSLERALLIGERQELPEL